MFFFAIMFDTSIIGGLLLAVSITLESTWSRVIYLGYPLNLVLAATMICSLGQYLGDSVSVPFSHLVAPLILVCIFKCHELEVAIYNCGWYGAPVPFRKLILQFMTQFTTTLGIDAEPFYPNFNLMLLAKVEIVIWNGYQ